MENLTGMILMPEGQGAVLEAEVIIGFSCHPFR
jgi:hypothetical protein